MPALLVKMSRDFLATRSKIPPRFPAAQKRISTECIYTFSRQAEGRHNTLDFAKAKSCAKEGCGPLWKPPKFARRSPRFQYLIQHFGIQNTR